jgi:L-iditol 2-dehydrogenase
MGLLAAQVARSLGATVVVLGQAQDEARLEVARGLGLATTTSEGEVGDADVSIDAAGSASGISAALRCARRGGRFVQLGLTGDDVDVPLDLIVMKELSTVTGFASTSRAWRSALSLVTEGRVSLEPLVSTVAPLAEWSTVFADLRLGRGMKSVIDPRLP